MAAGLRPAIFLLNSTSRETGADREEQKRDLESALAEGARRRVAIAAARLGDKEALKVVYPAGMSNDIIARENGVLAADLVELSSNRANLLAQKAERLATRDRLKASLAAREKLIAVNKEHVDMRESLSKSKAASRAQVIETLQQYEAQVTSQAGEKGQLLENEAALITLDRKLEEAITQFIADQMQKLADSERKADHLKGELIKATTKHERTRLTAPNAGTVQQLAVTTVGQVVSSGQPLMTIVPFGAPIEIEALIQNKDIGFVEVGQPAVVKVEILSLHPLRHGRGHRCQSEPRCRRRSRGQRPKRPEIEHEAPILGLRHREEPKSRLPRDHRSQQNGHHRRR